LLDAQYRGEGEREVVDGKDPQRASRQELVYGMGEPASLVHAPPSLQEQAGDEEAAMGEEGLDPEGSPREDVANGTAREVLDNDGADGERPQPVHLWDAAATRGSNGHHRACAGRRTPRTARRVLTRA